MALAMVLLAVGCTGKSLSPVGEVAIRPIDAAGLNGVLAQHRGQAVLVDFWATWCGPCVNLFPHTVALHRQFGGRGLKVVTVSLDDPDQQSAVRKFLVGQGATTENYLSSYGVGPAAFEAFAIDGGAIPHVRIYDRQGKLHRTFTGGDRPIDPANVARAAEEILGSER